MDAVLACDILMNRSADLADRIEAGDNLLAWLEFGGFVPARLEDVAEGHFPTAVALVKLTTNLLREDLERNG